MLARPGRGNALELLADTGLAPVVLPEISPPNASTAERERWRLMARVIDALDEPSLEVGLAILAEGAPGALPAVVDRLRLSNREGGSACWLRAAIDELAPRAADDLLMDRPWSTVQPWLANRDAPLLADVLRARAAVAGGSSEIAAWVSACLQRPRAELDPGESAVGGRDGQGGKRRPGAGDDLRALDLDAGGGRHGCVARSVTERGGANTGDTGVGREDRPLEREGHLDLALRRELHD
jgi:hypothetical protein